MDASSAAYANDQLGGSASNSADKRERQTERNLLASRSRRSISHFLGGTQLERTESSSGLSMFGDMISSSAETQAFTGTSESEHYLKDLITDNEIEQIRLGNENLLTKLVSVYVFEDATKVRSFLEDHPSVPDFLLEAVPSLRESFGDGAILQLQISPDEDVPLTIYAIALWNGTLDDARVALNKFDASWWTANGPKASGRVVVDYQLV
jgi:hypothetical protein